MRTTLTAIIGELTGAAATEVGPAFSLAHPNLAGSLGRAKLDAKIRRRLTVRLDQLGLLRTLAELEAAVLAAQGQSGTPAAPVNNAQSEPASPANAVAVPAPVRSAVELLPQFTCGVDLEQVSALPECADYWEEPFYQQHFTKAEIGYCLTQPNPRMHFAARWCLKEAVKKCGGEFSVLEFRHLEVAHAESGAPVIRVWREGGMTVAPLAVSLSHTEEWAVAVAVRPPVVPAAAPVPANVPPPSDRGSAVAMVIAVLALMLAGWSLWHR